MRVVHFLELYPLRYLPRVVSGPIALGGGATNAAGCDAVH